MKYLEFIDYAMPLWQSGLITVGVCLLGSAIICALFVLGIRHGFYEKHRNRSDDND